jgi:hypothetical protein
MASAIAPGNLFIGLLGAAFLLAAFLYFLLRRTRIFSQSKGIVADPLILLGSVGFGRGGWGWLPVSSYPVLSILSLKS